MNKVFPEFLGRNIELERIQRAIERSAPEPFWLDIVGEGGVGKTTLLNEIPTKLKGEHNFLFSRVIDFAQIRFFSQRWVMDSIAEADPTGFRKYRDLASVVQSPHPLSMSTDIPSKISKEFETEKAFVDCASTIAKERQRLIILIDTLEYVRETPKLYNFLLSLLSRIPYLTLITAGRPVNNEFESFKAYFTDYQKDVINLSGFSDEEAMEYFEKSVNGSQIGSEMRQKLALLTDRKPLKLALSIEWIRRGMSLPDLTQLSSIELKKMIDENYEEYEELVRDFEYELVQGFRNLQDPLSDIVLKMAHIYRRFNAELLRRLTKIHDIDKTKKQLFELPFFKVIDNDNFVLHDDVQRLIEEHIWQYIDPEGSIRKELSEIAVKYYDDLLKNSDAKLKEVEGKSPFSNEIEYEIRIFKVERMFYSLSVNLIEGFKEFNSLFDEFKNYHREELSALAVKFVKEYSRGLSPLVLGFLNTYNQGWLFVQHQEYSIAQQIIEKGLINIENLLSKIEVIDELDKVIETRLGDIYNLLGFCHRLQGNHLEAIENYEKAIKYLRENLSSKILGQQELSQQKRTISQIAETMNNLANVYRMMGSLEKARQLCHIGLLIRKKWGESRDIGNSYYVLGKISWENGGTAEAIGYFDMATREYTKAKLVINQAWVDRYLGYVRYRIGLLEEALPFIDRARAVFEEQYRQAELAETLNDLARISAERYSENDVPEEAIETANEALKIADQIGDRYRASECYLTLSNIYLILFKQTTSEAERVRWGEFAENYVKRGSQIARGKYNLFETLFSYIRGVLAYERGDYHSAFDEFLESCNLARQFKVAFFERALDTLGNYLLNLSYLNIEESILQCKQCIDRWKNYYILEKEYPQLIEEVEEILEIINETRRREDYRHRYNESMVQANYEEALKWIRVPENPTIYPHDQYYAQLLFDRARVLRRLYRYSEARRLCKLSLSIRRELKLDREIGDTHYLLGTILWEVGNNKEAVDQMHEAELCFRKANYNHGLGYVNRFLGYLFSRVRLYAEAEKRLQEAEKIFNEFNNFEGLANIHNTRSRLARINEKIEKKQRIDLAILYAEKAFDYATRAGNEYQKGEILLSLTIVHYLAERDVTKKKFNKTLKYYRKAKTILKDKNPLLLSILEGVHAVIQFEKGDFSKAFESFYRECQLAIGTKHMRLPRALEIMTDHLAKLPTKDATRICDDFIVRWQKDESASTHTEFINALSLLKEYHSYLFIASTHHI